MLVAFSEKLIPALASLQIPFTVVEGHKDIKDFKVVEVEREHCLKAVDERQQELKIIHGSLSRQAK